MPQVEILRKLQHPCVIQLLDAIQTDGKYYIVMEMAMGGELFDYIRAAFDRKKFNERIAKLQMYQLLKGIEYIHSKVRKEPVNYRIVRP